MMSQMPSRNSPCPCGSGRKFKRCCLVEEVEETTFTIVGPGGEINPTTPDGHTRMLSYKRELYQRWLDSPSAGLGGATPREAATVPDLRADLCRELHFMEQVEAVVISPASRMSLDFLWQELDIDRPHDAAA